MKLKDLMLTDKEILGMVWVLLGGEDCFGVAKIFPRRKSCDN